jgi:hypothetical protein
MHAKLKKKKTGGGAKLRIFSENRGRPVALSQKTEGGPSRVECDLEASARGTWVAGKRRTGNVGERGSASR